MDKKRRVNGISVNGGAGRVYLSFLHLARIDSKLSAPLHEYIDIFSGTSIGALGVLAFLQDPDDENKALNKVSELADYVRDHINQVFYTPYGPIRKGIRMVKGKPSYDINNLRLIMEDIVADIPLSKSHSGLLIPIINNKDGQIGFFKSPKLAKKIHGHNYNDYRAIDVVCAASSAYPIFKKFHISSLPDENGDVHDNLVFDAALRHNNPSQFLHRDLMLLSNSENSDSKKSTFQWIKDLFSKNDDFHQNVISLGVHKRVDDYDKEKLKNGYEVLLRVIELAMDSPGDDARQHMKVMRDVMGMGYYDFIHKIPIEVFKHANLSPSLDQASEEFFELFKREYKRTVYSDILFGNDQTAIDELSLSEDVEQLIEDISFLQDEVSPDYAERYYNSLKKFRPKMEHLVESLEHERQMRILDQMKKNFDPEKVPYIAVPKIRENDVKWLERNHSLKFRRYLNRNKGFTPAPSPQ